MRGPFAARVLAACRKGAETLERSPTVYRPMFVASGGAAAFAVVFKADRGPSAYLDVLNGSLIGPEGISLNRGVRQLLDRIGELSSGEGGIEALSPPQEP